MSLESEVQRRYLDSKEKAHNIADKSERKAALKRLKEQYKLDKPVEIYGEYFGSHQAIKRHINPLTLVAYDKGIDLYSGGSFRRRKELLVTIPWSSVTGFSFEEQTQKEGSSRITATRMVALGIFSVAAKKKSVEVDMKLVSTLNTKSGDIVIEHQSHIDNVRSGAGSMVKAADDMLLNANKRFRMSVAGHTGEHDSDEPIVI